MKTYYLSERLTVTDANALNGAISYGIPALTAFAGLSHAIERKTGIRVTGFAPIIHHMEVLGARSKYGVMLPFQKRQVPMKDASDAPFIDGANCDLDMTLVLEIELDESACQLRSAHKITQALSRCRIAGGTIARCDYGIIVDEIADELLIPGHGVRKLADIANSDMPETAIGVYSGQPGPVILTTGYAELENRGTELKGARAGEETVLVENAYSLCEFVEVSARTVASVFWRYGDNYQIVNC